MLAGQVKTTSEGTTYDLERGDIGLLTKGTKAYIEWPEISEAFGVTRPAVTDELPAAPFK